MGSTTYCLSTAIDLCFFKTKTRCTIVISPARNLLRPISSCRRPPLLLGGAPLHVAARRGRRLAASLLLSDGAADGRAAAEDGATAYRVAEEEGDAEMAELLERWRLGPEKEEEGKGGRNSSEDILREIDDCCQGQKTASSPSSSPPLWLRFCSQCDEAEGEFYTLDRTRMEDHIRSAHGGGEVPPRAAPVVEIGKLRNCFH